MDVSQCGRLLVRAGAAGALGISAEAVRQRIKRSTLTTEKDAGGTVYVLVDADMTRTNADSTTDMPTDQAGLVEVLREQVAYLREQLDQERQARTEERRRHDTLMAQLMQRIPELEASPEAREAPETASEEHAKGDDDDTEEEHRPWWRRMFGA